MKKYIASLIILFGIIVLLIINYRTPFFQQDGGGWSVGYGESNTYPENINVKENQVYSIESLKKQNDSTVFLADPFFVKEKDTFYLFFEHKKTKNNGDIGLMTSVDGKKYQYRGTVLTQKFHLSYPQVFKYKNNFYMIPESKQANAILLYKAHHFPFDWKVCDTLLKNVRLKDPSIYLSDSLNILATSDDKLNLYIYQADSLFGKWKLHKKTIALRGTEARPGGRFFADKKGLILPVQNCTNGYGCGLSLYRFSFKDGSYSTARIAPFFLKGNKDIKEFSAGMHQLDVQRIDNNKYYYVYDGNRLNSDSKKLNIYGPLKWTYVDLKNWILNR
ncbi:glucosamine inositolphosphorylceramide transferase family protein [Flavobacterium anhuiense]|uniref:glucosamine inositolphosphorylceramide transferase family protein n=1 Tax=Flavobacterium anhuiense TaxID=459526 RepID=UPI003D992D34